MELSELQKKIVEAPDRKVVVFSSAASGKTRTLTEKVRYLLRQGANPRDVAVVTFTNMAAAELRQRLGEDYKEGLFVGTIHALANYMLLSNGIKTNKILDEEKFDELFEMVAKNPYCVRHYEWILLDEAQDTDKLQFQFILDLINPECFFIVGDARQSIYQFRAARPDLFLRLAHSEQVKLFDMNENYRNGSNILNFAKNLIRPTGLEDTSISKTKNNGSVTEISFNSDFIVSKIFELDTYSDWAILARTNAEVDKMTYILKRNIIPCETFKQRDLTKAELIDKMQTNTVKVLTVHSSKGLEWKNVVVTGMRYNPLEERNVCYVAATRAKENLIWTSAARRRKRY